MQKSHCGFLKTRCEKLFLDQLVVQVSLHMAPSFLVNVQLFVCFLLLFGKGFVCVLNTLHLNENLLSSARANKSVFYSLRLHTVVNIGGTSDVYFGL